MIRKQVDALVPFVLKESTHNYTARRIGLQAVDHTAVYLRRNTCFRSGQVK